MTDDGGQRGRSGGLRRSAPARPARVGDPNVLTNAATPNRLSAEVAGSQGSIVPSRPVASASIATGRPAMSAQPATPFDGRAAPRKRRLSLSTLIFLAFAAITVFRFLGQVADRGSATATPTPRPIVGSTAPGPIVFGNKQSDDCKIEDPTTSFASGEGIRWVAQLSEFQASDAGVVVLFLHDGSRFNREDVPPDPSVGKWDTLCSGDPVSESSAGHYILEIWNESLTQRLARGGYDVAAP